MTVNETIKTKTVDGIDYKLSRERRGTYSVAYRADAWYDLPHDKPVRQPWLMNREQAKDVWERAGIDYMPNPAFLAFAAQAPMYVKVKGINSKILPLD